MEKPNVPMSGDGFYYTPEGRPLCEDCWQPIPRYVDFPHGLTSPQSMGDSGGNFIKKRQSAIDGKSAIEPLRKAVCLSCYYQAFAIVYPGATPPELSNQVIPDTHAYTPESTVESEFVGSPRGV